MPPCSVAPGSCKILGLIERTSSPQRERETGYIGRRTAVASLARRRVAQVVPVSHRSRLRHPSVTTMRPLAELGERIAATTKKTEKVAMVAEYFRSHELPDAAISAFSVGTGVSCLRRAHAADRRIARCGSWSARLTGAREASLTAAYRKRGDLGAAAYDVLLAKAPHVCDHHLAGCPRPPSTRSPKPVPPPPKLPC